MRMQHGGEQSVGSIGEEQKAVNSVDVNDKIQTENDKLKKSAEGSENKEKGVDYKVKEGQDKELEANSDCKGETKENSDKETEKESVGNKDKSQDKETEEETKKSKDGVKNEAVNEEDKAKFRVAGHVKGPGKAKRKTVKMDGSFEEPDRYATPRAVNMNRQLPTAREGNVFTGVCPQSVSWLLVHCSALLQRGRYASYSNDFLLIN